MDILRILKILYEYLIEKEKPTDEALLTEYQALQHDVNSSGSSYWTLASIFIGISSALLLGSVFGVITNEDLYQSWLKQLQGEPSQIQALQTIITVIGVFAVLMLSFVRLWLRRVTFLQQINFERMREIESRLGMWKSWRVHGIDHWNVKAYDFDDEVSDKPRLTSYKPKGWWCKWRVSRRYARPSGWHYNGIFAVLIFLWLFLVFTVSFPLTFPTSILGILIIGVVDFFVIHFTRVHNKEQTS